MPLLRLQFSAQFQGCRAYLIMDPCACSFVAYCKKFGFHISYLPKYFCRANQNLCIYVTGINGPTPQIFPQNYVVRHFTPEKRILQFKLAAILISGCVNDDLSSSISLISIETFEL
ncbi:hypothetical protein VNO77_28623 [Canavalia gladiata]|uniref:Uncharacterized protein n=1 Tax=Canavalia gladiata TaxID=3824 RepID=A0AAN9Q7C6_CANGL